MNAYVELGQWHRLLFGSAPEDFLLEVLFRTALMYISLMLIVRLLGKRMSGQLSNLELAVMVTLGAIVSSPMQVGDRGMLGALVLLCVVLCLQRGLGALTARSARAERLVFGHGTTLVRDGRIVVSTMKQACISHEQLFGTLRNHGVTQLGEVRRVYLEASGVFSVIKRDRPLPGLAILPAADRTKQKDLARADLSVCRFCGRVVQHADAKCADCGRTDWAMAASGAPAAPTASHSEAQGTDGANAEPAQAHARGNP
jgi:uncharacterized membrane protein YcaP (DUF421 family)